MASHVHDTSPHIQPSICVREGPLFTQEYLSPSEAHPNTHLPGQGSAGGPGMEAQSPRTMTSEAGWLRALPSSEP